MGSVVVNYVKFVAVLSQQGPDGGIYGISIGKVLRAPYTPNRVCRISESAAIVGWKDKGGSAADGGAFSGVAVDVIPEILQSLQMLRLQYVGFVVWG